MNETEVTLMLSSANDDVVLEALRVLGAEAQIAPSNELSLKAMTHFRHQDEDVRREAIFAVAVHWGFVPAFDELMSVVHSERSAFVAETAVSAITRIAQDQHALRSKAIEVLARIALAVGKARSLRTRAFIEAKWLAGEIDAREHAAELATQDAVTIDAGWLEATLERLTRRG
jgi:hypothetical protein